MHRLTKQKILFAQHSNHRDNSPAFQSLGLNPPAFQSPGLNFNHWDSILRHSNTGTQPTSIPITGTILRHFNHWDSHLGIFFVYSGVEPVGIRVLDTRHEATAVFAADAAARLRQDIGVAAVTAGSGITNTVTALKSAQMAESPVLLLGGASPSLLKGRGALQDIDQQTLVRSLCKFSARVTCVRHIMPTIRNAIATAKSGTPDPARRGRHPTRTRPTRTAPKKAPNPTFKLKKENT
ncbi:hypothetical protein niasHT_036339 [Heterodera trifolii]|uniref:Thiamine pyrophosphate enzyme N-terminal TPP-binding domain-containing protein n=1 Tax=Heterodera trifolii TaxID=157864 RepID=A0ABD2IGT1_9BILA